MAWGYAHKWKPAPAGVKCNVNVIKGKHAGVTCNRSPIPEGALAYHYGYEDGENIWWCYDCAMAIDITPPNVDAMKMPNGDLEMESIGDEADKRYEAKYGGYWVITETEHKCTFGEGFSICNQSMIPPHTICMMISSSAYCELCCAIYTDGLIPPGELKAELEVKLAKVGGKVATKSMVITSFGFRNGAPELLKTERILDVRDSIRNPWRNPTLRKLTGLDPQVREFIARCPNTAKIIQSVLYYPFIGVTNLYVGCYGGKHRSVAIAAMIAEDLKVKGIDVSVVHRDLKFTPAVEE